MPKKTDKPGIDFEALKAPWPPEEIKWRIKKLFVEFTPPKALCIPYIDPRQVMERLDAVCGQFGWQISHKPAGSGVIAEIAIKDGVEWVSKSDGSDIRTGKGAHEEPFKTAVSDAIKRVAVLWGIGRYLYEFDAQWAFIENTSKSSKPNWVITGAALNKLAEYIASGSPTPHAPINNPPAAKGNPQLTAPPPVTQSSPSGRPQQSEGSNIKPTEFVKEVTADLRAALHQGCLEDQYKANYTEWFKIADQEERKSIVEVYNMLLTAQTKNRQSMAAHNS